MAGFDSTLWYNWKQGSIFLSLHFLFCRMSGVRLTEKKKSLGGFSGPAVYDSGPRLENRVHQSLETKMIFN